MKKKKRNRVILAICSMFIACMSIFAFIPKQKEIVKADSVVSNYIFDGSNLNIICNTEIQGRDDVIYVCFGNYDFIIKKVNNQLSFDVDINVCMPRSSDYVVPNYEFLIFNGDNLSINNSFHYFYLYSYFNTIDWRIYLETQSNDINSFIPNIYKLRLYSTYQFTDNKHINYNIIRYYDINENWLEFRIISYYSTLQFSDYFTFDDRTYFLLNTTELTDNQLYQTAYFDGYNSGKIDGINLGNAQGYTDGYNIGKNDGYNLGYNEALTNSGNYTFDSLLSAVIDVPVRTFTSLFNFEILGVNLSGFFLGLLTCCIVITIVRLLL